MPSITATTGFLAATVAMASCSASPPATLPPGLSIYDDQRLDAGRPPARAHLPIELRGPR